MTNFALTLYRRETRAALEKALGRKVTNDEHNAFIVRLQIHEINKWADKMAVEEARRLSK